MSSINLQLTPDSLSQGESAIRQDLALQLYAQNIFTFGQGRRLAFGCLANLSVWEFQQLLGEKKIERHYSEVDLLEDVKTIQEGF
ncbi:UPF0175 family protein [Dolichospermum sp. LEGE 00240]|uniref:UPF0175 family protein n=1 Tax=Dolichospermum sp. LEGE 00240 TaxID=1828603 RepID=UPI00187FE97B|nr:UPF0175 family protein [Dolichospermum sp. LEGE 00240]MDM3849507.1 UPF0175 family protein [Aphanizomenon gracile PMC627.10]MDM3860694.1 UPF0175 family protein [Aphanizomenon gracile PMC644.10]